MLTYNIDLDVTAGARPALIHLKQYQTDAQLVFKLYTTSGTLSIGTVTDCSIRGTKSDGNGFSATATYSSGNQTVSFHVTDQMTAVAGKQPYELTLTDSTGKMITATFWLDVQRAAFDMDTPSDSVIRELIDALDRTDEILQAAQDVSDAASSFAQTQEEFENAVEEFEDSWDDLLDDFIDDTLSEPNKAAEAKKTGDYFTLLSDDVPNTIQSYEFSNGTVSRVAHNRNGTTIRTDRFSYGSSTITEIRTLYTGESLTIVTNLETLETTVSYSTGE